MKSLSVGLLAHYAQEVMQLTNLLKITRLDGDVFGFSEHDQAIAYDGVVYEPQTGFTSSQIDTSSGLNVSGLDVTGPFRAVALTVAEFEAGIWNKASWELFEVCWADLSLGRNLLLTGRLGQFKRVGEMFVAELRTLTSLLQLNQGRVVAPTCDVAHFGDARCGIDLGPLTIAGAAVTSVTSRRQFVASGLAQATGYFDYGKVTFETGENSGYVQEIKSHTSPGIIELRFPFPFAVSASDLFTISPGCNRLLKTADEAYLGDCKVKWDNVVNFRGMPEVPLQNRVIQFIGR